MSNDASSVASTIAEEFDPFNEPYVSDQWSFHARARKVAPVFYSDDLDLYVVTRYADVRAIMADPDSFSSDILPGIITPPYQSTVEEFAKHGRAIEYLTGPTMVNEDEPMHRVHRKSLAHLFLPRVVAEHEPAIRDLANSLIDGFVKKGHADLVEELVWEYPARVLLKFVMGVPDEKAKYVKKFSQERTMFSWGRPTEEQQNFLAREVGLFAKFCEEHVNYLRDKPGDDLVSKLIQANQEDPETFPELIIYSYMINLLFAGHDTTSGTITNAIRMLLEHRDQWEDVCHDPGLIPDAFEEVVRLFPSVNGWQRRTTKPVQIAGIDIPENSRILMIIGSANRDEEEFGEDAEKFDIRREGNKRHLGFSHGIHNCIGAPLARLEAKILLEELTRRLPHMTLVEGQRWEYIPDLFSVHPLHLLAEWDPSSNPIPEDRP